MRDEICLTLPSGAVNIHADIQAVWPLILPALDTIVSEFDTHAQFECASLYETIVNGCEVQIVYHTHYHVYHPCRGLDIRDFCTRSIRGKILHDQLILTPYQPLPERSTADEF